jgi:MFS superfamily sulfate permease-like transporter
LHVHRFESALYFASQERFKNQIYKRVMDPRMRVKKTTVVKVVIDDKPIDGNQGGCAGRFGAGKKRLRQNSEQMEVVTVSMTARNSVANNANNANNGLNNNMEMVNKAYVHDENGGGAVMGDAPPKYEPNGDATTPASNGHSGVTQRRPGPLEGALHIPHHATPGEKGLQTVTGDDDSDIQDDVQLPENHHMPRKSLHGEIVFEPESNVKVAEPDPEAADLRFLILDCSCMVYIDVSGTDMLQTIVQQFSRAGVDVLLAATPRKTLNTLRRAQLIGHPSRVPEDHVFYSVLDAVHWVRRTQEHLIVVKF